MRLRSLMVIAAALVLSGCDVPGSPTTVRLEEANSSVASDIVFLEMISAREIKLGEKITTPEKLLGNLKAELGDRKPEDVRILIKPNPGVSYEGFVVVLKILQDAGYTRIGIINSELTSEQ